MSSPLVSVLIANYNNGNFFIDCYKSIIEQTYSNWEAIIVDDGSVDNSVGIIKQLIRNDERFKFYENPENKGCGYTKRRCVDLANGEICAFVDPDDAITENALALMANAHINQPDCSLIYSQFYYWNAGSNVKSKHQSKLVAQNDAMFFNFNGVISHFSSFKRSFYYKTAGISESLKRAIDQDLYLKLYEVGKIFFIDEYLYLYRVHSGGISTNSNIDNAFFWHWVVIIDAAKRRNINVENLFYEKFVRRRKYLMLEKKLNQTVQYLNQSRWLKLGQILRLTKFQKFL
jgi:glycosyltransferase involved in cell wall biosynthesis